jgi:hypothetical protein
MGIEDRAAAALRGAAGGPRSLEMALSPGETDRTVRLAFGFYLPGIHRLYFLLSINKS